MSAIQELRQFPSQPLNQPPIRESLLLPVRHYPPQPSLQEQRLLSARRLETPGSIFHEYLCKFDARHDPFLMRETPTFSQNYCVFSQDGYHVRFYPYLKNGQNKYFSTILPYSDLYLQAYHVGKKLHHQVQLSNSDNLPIIFDNLPSFKWDSTLGCPTATLPEIKGPTLEALLVYNKVSAYREFQAQIAHMNNLTLPDITMARFSSELLESLAIYNQRLNSRLGYGQSVVITPEDVVVSTENLALNVYNLHPKQ